MLLENGLTRGEIRSEPFTLLAVQRPAREQGSAHVYIEGDGRPWIAGGEVVASDPTPRHPLALEWMSDDARGMLYLGRPCYFGQADVPPCGPALWTSARYSEPVVVAMAGAVQQWLDRHPEVGRLTLIGHSGGGILALFLGERLAAVERVVAVASPVDHRRWAQLHDYTPLTQSLNVADYGPWRAGVERVLVFGEADDNVPAVVFGPIAAAIPGARVIRVPGMAHHECCGALRWRDFLVRRIGAAG